MFIITLLFFGVSVSLAFSATIEKCQVVTHHVTLLLAGLDAGEVPCDDPYSINRCDLVLKVHNGNGDLMCKKTADAGDDQPKISDEDGSPWRCSFSFDVELKEEPQSIAKFYILDDDGSDSDADYVCTIELIFKKVSLRRGYWRYLHGFEDKYNRDRMNDRTRCRSSSRLSGRLTYLTGFRFDGKTTCAVEKTTPDAETSLTTSWIAKAMSTDMMTPEKTVIITEVSTTATDVMMTSTIKETSAISMVTRENVEETSTEAGITLEGTAYENQGVASAKAIWLSVCLVAFLVVAVILSYVYMRFYRRKKAKAMLKQPDLSKKVTRDIVAAIDQKTNNQGMLSNTSSGNESQSKILDKETNVKVNKAVQKIPMTVSVSTSCDSRL